MNESSSPLKHDPDHHNLRNYGDQNRIICALLKHLYQETRGINILLLGHCILKSP